MSSCLALGEGIHDIAKRTERLVDQLALIKSLSCCMRLLCTLRACQIDLQSTLLSLDAQGMQKCTCNASSIIILHLTEM